MRAINHLNDLNHPQVTVVFSKEERMQIVYFIEQIFKRDIIKYYSFKKNVQSSENINL